MKISTLIATYRHIFWLLLFPFTINAFGNTTLHNCTGGSVSMTVNYQGRSGGDQGGEVLSGSTRTITLDCISNACAAYCYDKAGVLDAVLVDDLKAGLTDLYCFEDPLGQLDVSGDSSDC